MATLEIAKPHLFTAEEYLRLDISERTELLEGVIYDVSPRNEPHSVAVKMLNRILARGLPDAHALRVRDAVAVPDWRGRNAPEVDIAVLRGTHFDPGPTAADSVAFIEVSDTTYADDRRYKIPLYVTAGVPSWIVNIGLRHVEGYASTDDLRREHGVVIATGQSFEIAGVVIPVDALFR